MSLCQIWVDLPGDINLWPGKIVKIIFPQIPSSVNGTVPSLNFSGYWMVSRVVHRWTNVYTTRLLLSRQGVDSSANKGLLESRSIYNKKYSSMRGVV
jgi:hypothetical protein